STVQIPLSSDSGEGLEAAALELQREMAGLHTLADPRPATEPPAPEVIIRPRPDDAARLGVSSDTLASVARVATVGDIDTNVAKLSDAYAEINRLPIMHNLPAGVKYETNFSNQQAQNQLFAGFGVAIFAGIGLVYGVMVLLFGSFFKPITILSALPLTLAG